LQLQANYETEGNVRENRFSFVFQNSDKKITSLKKNTIRNKKQNSEERKCLKQNQISEQIRFLKTDFWKTKI
jgi:hypothetical protein